MMIADLHLIGQLLGNSIDRLKRESQMRTAFHTAVRQLEPDLIFILGDILDEGKWSFLPEDFRRTTGRYRKYFSRYVNSMATKKKIDLHVLTGNHDVGFHYDVDNIKVHRFEKSFNASKVKFVSEKGVNFLLLNSVLMRNDSCALCLETQKQLREAKAVLDCIQISSKKSISKKCSDLVKKHEVEELIPDVKPDKISQPIILQHFPLYRANESSCFSADWNSLNLNISKPLEQDWDVLSKQTSRNLVDMFNPRLVFSGHSHYNCEIWHRYFADQRRKVLEVTVNSFSWRNNDNPKILLLTIDRNSYTYSLCHLPRESAQFAIYCLLWGYSLIYIVRKCRNANVHYFPRLWKTKSV